MAEYLACMGERLEGLYEGGETEGEKEDEGRETPHHVGTVPAKRVLQARVLAQLNKDTIGKFSSLVSTLACRKV